MGLKKILAVAMTAGMIMSFMPATAMADGGVWRQYSIQERSTL